MEGQNHSERSRLVDLVSLKQVNLKGKQLQDLVHGELLIGLKVIKVEHQWQMNLQEAHNLTSQPNGCPFTIGNPLLALTGKQYSNHHLLLRPHQNRNFLRRLHAYVKQTLAISIQPNCEILDMFKI